MTKRDYWQGHGPNDIYIRCTISRGGFTREPTVSIDTIPEDGSSLKPRPRHFAVSSCHLLIDSQVEFDLVKGVPGLMKVGVMLFSPKYTSGWSPTIRLYDIESSVVHIRKDPAEYRDREGKELASTMAELFHCFAKGT